MRKTFFFVCVFPFFLQKRRRGVWVSGGFFLVEGTTPHERRGRSLRNNHLASPSLSFKHTYNIYLNTNNDQLSVHVSFILRRGGVSDVRFDESHRT